MAKLTTRTIWQVLRLRNDGGTVLGQFKLIRVYRFGSSALMFHDITGVTDRVYPVHQVWSAKLTIL